MRAASASFFTKKEKEIIELLLKGLPPKEIAQIGNCSINTMRSHLRNIHSKSQTHTIPQLLVWSYNHPEKLT